MGFNRVISDTFPENKRWRVVPWKERKKNAQEWISGRQIMGKNHHGGRELYKKKQKGKYKYNFTYQETYKPNENLQMCRCSCREQRPCCTPTKKSNKKCMKDYFFNADTHLIKKHHAFCKATVIISDIIIPEVYMLQNAVNPLLCSVFLDSKMPWNYK